MFATDSFAKAWTTERPSRLKASTKDTDLGLKDQGAATVLETKVTLNNWTSRMLLICTKKSVHGEKCKVLYNLICKYSPEKKCKFEISS